MVCILPGLPAFYLKKWLFEVKWYRNYFESNIQWRGWHRAISLNNQVHTTPHPVLQFLGICMGPVQYPNLFLEHNSSQQWYQCLECLGRAISHAHLFPSTQSLVIHHYIFVCVSLNSSSFLELQHSLLSFIILWPYASYL